MNSRVGCSVRFARQGPKRPHFPCGSGGSVIPRGYEANYAAVPVVPSPDLNELRSFCTAADLGSIGRAAVRLHVSQPALSKRLASLEAKVGAKLLERSPHGVALTPAGRRLYAHASGLLDTAEEVSRVIAGIRRASQVVRLAASHSAAEAFVAAMLTDVNAQRPLAVELVTANSQVVRALVADGSADIGIAVSRPGQPSFPGVRESDLADDAIVCAVPPGHAWARTGRVTQRRFVDTPMVVRDPSSAARLTTDAVLSARGLRAAAPLVEAATPRAALAEARRRGAPVLLSRHIVAGSDFTTVVVRELEFPRRYVLVAPMYGEPAADVRALIERTYEHVRLWLR